MKALLIFLAAIGAASAWAAGGGGGAGGGDSPAKPADPVIEKAQAAIAAKNWQQAQDTVREGLAKTPDNADYHNLFAYSMRMGANPPMDLVFRHYNEALRIDKSHRAAHEYLGEAYLMSGNLDKAREHLKVLDGLCFLPCQEYSMLKKAVADYEATRQPRTSSK